MLNVRKDFPILTKVHNGHQIVYFDNAATTQKPYQVIHAIVDLLEHHNGNPHRGAHVLSIEAGELYDEAREAVRKSQRERREYEKKREECEKIKAECEKIKRNLGRIIRQKSIELINKSFPEIEQEKLAAKIKKLDEVARQDFFIHQDNEGKQY